jgi:alpha-glucosidase
MKDTRPWWQDGVVYQIYPRSFADSNGDGIGDLRGIIEHLDYLNGGEDSLGVDALWLSPIHPSPMHDFGYDVSDYRGISPEYGTHEDFKRLLQEAHRRGIRILLDLVFNHTSHEHPWFQEAASSRQSPKRDWFIWHDGKPGRRPPNNWLSAFGGPAWTWHAPTSQFYLHTFLPQQPDVNWRNPELREALFDVIRYWLELGVDGFRLDVVNWFIKDAQLRDNPWHFRGRRPYDWQHHRYDRNRPETLEVMKQLRRVVDAFPGRTTVGEVFTEAPGNPALPAEYYAGGEGLHMAFNFAFLYCPWEARAFASAVERWELLLGQDLWPNYTLSNHDQPRAYGRYSRGGDAEARARVAAALLLTLRGTPFLYYGEELGMGNGRIPRARLQDPVGQRYWPFHSGRDPERTPMQWSSAPHAGFSPQEPWLPLNPDWRTRNAEAQRSNPRSLFHWYRRLLRLRRERPALHRGSFRVLPQPSPHVFGYVRQHEGQRITVLLNFSSRPQPVRLEAGEDWRVLLASSGFEPGAALRGERLELPGDGALLAESGGSPSGPHIDSKATDLR